MKTISAFLVVTIIAGFLSGCSSKMHDVAPAAPSISSSWKTNPPVLVIDDVIIPPGTKSQPPQISSKYGKLYILMPDDKANNVNDLKAKYGPQAKNGVLLFYTNNNRITRSLIKSVKQ
ncbi:hypothetical protein [Larkinella arboricola]|uniref:hypothetical protein n=1 Tax=Larkinella arboricola TaxID=643671 RepID=UPI0014756E17|nr:hypothetical protein [Larkinella arboricola]